VAAHGFEIHAASDSISGPAELMPAGRLFRAGQRVNPVEAEEDVTCDVTPALTDGGQVAVSLAVSLAVTSTRLNEGPSS
jgi:hypothetical protein